MRSSAAVCYNRWKCSCTWIAFVIGFSWKLSVYVFIFKFFFFSLQSNCIVAVHALAFLLQRFKHCNFLQCNRSVLTRCFFITMISISLAHLRFKDRLKLEFWFLTHAYVYIYIYILVKKKNYYYVYIFKYIGTYYLIKSCSYRFVCSVNTC